MMAARIFGIVPAAGTSQRMGRPKLLLPISNRPIIDHVLSAWVSSSVCRTLVITRADETGLVDRCREFDVELLTTVPPPRDMKQSIQTGLWHLEHQYRPTMADAWAIAPADMPELTASLIDRLLDAYRSGPPRIVAPVYGGRRGHPVVFPWQFAAVVHRLRDNEGIHVLTRDCPVDHVAVETPAVLHDVDTPEDYQRLQDGDACWQQS